MDKGEYLVVHWEGSGQSPAGFVRLPSEVDTDLATLRHMIDVQVEAVSLKRRSRGEAWDYRFLLTTSAMKGSHDMERGTKMKIKGGKRAVQSGGVAYLPVSPNQEEELMLSDLIFGGLQQDADDSSLAIILRPIEVAKEQGSQTSKKRHCSVAMLVALLFSAALISVATFDFRGLPSTNAGNSHQQNAPMTPGDHHAGMAMYPPPPPPSSALLIVVDPPVNSGPLYYENRPQPYGAGDLELQPADGGVFTPPDLPQYPLRPQPAQEGGGVVVEDPAGGYSHHHDRHHDANPWVGVVRMIVATVRVSVQGYFITFNSCWQSTGSWLVEMIEGYFSLLKYLIGHMLHLPVTIVLVVAVGISLHYATLMIKEVIPYKYVSLANGAPALPSPKEERPAEAGNEEDNYLVDDAV